MKASLLYVILLSALMECKHSGSYPVDEKLFNEGERTGNISDTKLKEASGIEASVENPGMLWVHNDSGNNSEIFLINKEGNIMMTVRFKEIENNDWEDIALLNNKNGSFIYIGDIGDNLGRRKKLFIHKLREPKYTGEAELEISRESLETMTFTYTNGARDAETLMVDPDTEELIIVTKRERECLVYAFPFNRSSKDKVEVAPAGKIPLKQLTGGDINGSGEILLKNYEQVFYWSASDASVANRLIRGPDFRISYQEEPQGEAICWNGEASFFTLSEFHQFSKQYLYFYKRAE